MQDSNSLTNFSSKDQMSMLSFGTMSGQPISSISSIYLHLRWIPDWVHLILKTGKNVKILNEMSWTEKNPWKTKLLFTSQFCVHVCALPYLQL